MTASTDPSPLTLSRALLHSADSGILSTQSLELPGYPFGSVTPYVTSTTGQPTIFVSDIAQHTANMNADPKCCLSVQQAGGGNQQELGRLTFVGDAVKVPEAHLEAASARYYTFFPHARHYGQAHAFSFYWVEPVRLRYIRGFGQIFWIEKEEWSTGAPAWQDQEAAMIEHMNTDHQRAMQRILASQLDAEVPASLQLQMLAIDPEGCHLRAGEAIHYVPFQARCETADAVRQALIAMARAS